MNPGYRIGQGGYKIGRSELAQGMQLRASDSAVVRYYVAGIPPTAAVAAAAAIVPTTGPLTRPFRGERFIVPSAVAPAFLLTALSSGSDSVFVSVGGVSCGTFSELAVGAGLDFPTTLVGTGLTAGITNISLAPAVFTAAILGYAAVVN